VEERAHRRAGHVERRLAGLGLLIHAVQALPPAELCAGAGLVQAQQTRNSLDQYLFQQALSLFGRRVAACGCQDAQV